MGVTQVKIDINSICTRQCTIGVPSRFLKNLLDLNKEQMIY